MTVIGCCCGHLSGELPGIVFLLGTYFYKCFLSFETAVLWGFREFICVCEVLLMRITFCKEVMYSFAADSDGI